MAALMIPRLRRIIRAAPSALGGPACGVALALLFPQEDSWLFAIEAVLLLGAIYLMVLGAIGLIRSRR